MEGFIGIYRKMMKWEWYQDHNTKAVFLHLLLLASHEGGRWQGQSIERGQLITGRKRLAKDLKLSERQIRTSLSKLKSTNEIAIKATNKNSVITITEYDTYNPKDRKRPSKPPAKRPATSPTSDQRATTLKNVKNEKEEKIRMNFDLFWKVYPTRNGKKKEKDKTWNRYRALPERYWKEVYIAVHNYARDDEIRQGIGIRDPKRFLADKFWREYLKTAKIGKDVYRNLDGAQGYVDETDFERAVREEKEALSNG